MAYAPVNTVSSSACQRLPNKLTAEKAVGSNRGEQEANQLTSPSPYTTHPTPPDGMTSDSSSQPPCKTLTTKDHAGADAQSDMRISVHRAAKEAHFIWGNNESAAEGTASQHKRSQRMALQMKSPPEPLKPHRSLFFRCWHRWTWRAIIKGHFLQGGLVIVWGVGESVLFFTQFNMQPGGFISIPFCASGLRACPTSLHKVLSVWLKWMGKPGGHELGEGQGDSPSAWHWERVRI